MIGTKVQHETDNNQRKNIEFEYFKLRFPNFDIKVKGFIFVLSDFEFHGN